MKFCCNLSKIWSWLNISIFTHQIHHSMEKSSKDINFWYRNVILIQFLNQTAPAKQHTYILRVIYILLIFIAGLCLKRTIQKTSKWPRKRNRFWNSKRKRISHSLGVGSFPRTFCCYYHWMEFWIFDFINWTLGS